MLVSRTDFVGQLEMSDQRTNKGRKYGGNNTARVYHTAYSPAFVHVSQKQELPLPSLLLSIVLFLQMEYQQSDW